MSRNDLWRGSGPLMRIGGVLFSLLVLAISGCARSSPPAEPVTITFAYSGGDADTYRTLIEKFNESYPNITVELDTSGGDPTSEENPADVFLVSPFEFSDLQQEGSILSLDPFIEQDESFDVQDFYPGTVQLCTREDRLLAIPAGVDMLVMYYNRDLFDEYGVPYPQPGWTWDDFLNSALTLRDPGAGVFGYVIINQFIDPLPFIYQHGGRILDDMQNPTRATFDDPLTIEAMDWYAGLIHTHNVAPTSSQLFDAPFNSSAEAGVYVGKVGMWMDWLSNRGGGGDPEGTWPGEWKMNWAMAPLPRDAQSVTAAYVLGYAISTHAASPDAGWQWIRFLSNQVQIPYGLLPARKSIAESDAYRQLLGRDSGSIAQESMASALLLSPALVEFGNPFVYGNAINEIVNGTSTAEEALTEAQRQAGQ